MDASSVHAQIFPTSCAWLSSWKSGVGNRIFPSAGPKEFPIRRNPTSRWLYTTFMPSRGALAVSPVLAAVQSTVNPVLVQQDNASHQTRLISHLIFDHARPASDDMVVIPGIMASIVTSGYRRLIMELTTYLLAECVATYLC